MSFLRLHYIIVWFAKPAEIQYTFKPFYVVSISAFIFFIFVKPIRSGTIDPAYTSRIIVPVELSDPFIEL